MARTTDIICSINRTVSEAVTINSAWAGADNGTITLSATVPATVVIGDIIADSAGNSYLITGISGSDLTAQDFDTTTDPTTGAGATITGAYGTVVLWEADLDVTTLYTSGDDATGEVYNDGGDLDESVTINGGGTVGLNYVILTVPVGERHDGTANTGVRNLRTGINGFQMNCISGGTVSWFEIDMNANRDYALGCASNVGDVLSNNILHGISSSANGGRYGIKSEDPADILNNFIYDIEQLHTVQHCYGLYAIANTVDVRNVHNNTVFNTVNTGGIGSCFGIVNANHSGMDCRGNISLDTTGTASGTIQDYATSSPTTGTHDYNMASDTTASGANSINSVTSSDVIVSTTGGSEDLHLKTGSAAINVGTDLGTTPDGVQFDIDNYDRDTDSLGYAATWDMGAHEFATAAAAGNPWYYYNQQG